MGEPEFGAISMIVFQSSASGRAKIISGKATVYQMRPSDVSLRGVLYNSAGRDIIILYYRDQWTAGAGLKRELDEAVEGPQPSRSQA